MAMIGQIEKLVVYSSPLGLEARKGAGQLLLLLDRRSLSVRAYTPPLRSLTGLDNLIVSHSAVFSPPISSLFQRW